MKSISLQTVAEWVGGRLCGENKQINNVSIDSRTVDASTLFIAIRGDRFDAFVVPENLILKPEFTAAELACDIVIPVRLGTLAVCFCA